MEKPPQAISFDVVGTFLHFAEPVAETYDRFGREYGLRVSTTTIRKRIDMAFQVAPGMVPSRDEDATAFEREWWLKLAERVFGCAPDDKDFLRCFDALFVHYAGTDAWRMNPEFPDFLVRLKETGTKLAIISNFDARLYGLLDSFSLSGLFDAVILPGNAGFQKPQPGMFRFTSVQLGIPPSGILHLGDQEEEDVQAAKNAGMEALLWSFPVEGAERATRRVLSIWEWLNQPSGYTGQDRCG